MTVDSFEDPGSFSRIITYSNSLSEIATVTAVSTHCKQYLKYECSKSRLFLGGPWAWWVSRDGQKMFYWGGADPANSQSCDATRQGIATNPRNISATAMPTVYNGGTTKET